MISTGKHRAFELVARAAMTDFPLHQVLQPMARPVIQRSFPGAQILRDLLHDDCLPLG